MKFFRFLARLFSMKQPQDANTLSPAAEKLLLDYEVGGGRNYFERFLARPSWPGVYSGVTIGIGYDLGYNSSDTIRRDWSGLVSGEDLEALVRCSGVKGRPAQDRALAVRYIRIPWDAALTVFRKVTIPKFAKLTRTTFPGSEKLHPDAFGALVSLVFNRGSSVKGSRRREMLAIRALVPRADYKGIAREILNMKRLWSAQTMRGLHYRRNAEANLVASCAA